MLDQNQQYNTQLIQKALQLATTWQNKAQDITTDFEKRFHIKMEKILTHPRDKFFLIQLMDQSFRSKNPTRVKNQVEYLFSKYGMASFFTNSERFLTFFFRHLGAWCPQIAIPLFLSHIRQQSQRVVLRGEMDALNRYLLRRRREDTRVNINLIGEVVLGEKEAHHRMNKYLEALKQPNIDYLSIKISTIFSQINSLSHESTVRTLSHRLIDIYTQAQKYTYVNQRDEKESKFVNLDMEEYRDLSLTVDSFKKALEHPNLLGLKAGIVLQAYLPEAHFWQRNLTEWAQKRIHQGGSPIKIRLVKGANMEMEQTEASLRNWEQAPYREKIDTDSNYKVMTEYALQPENICAVHLGVGSHNLFEVAYCHELAKKNEVMKYVSFEMLEGISEPARKAIKDVSGIHPIVYTPVAEKEQFTNAIAYLVRRLDENTSENHFLRYSFSLTTKSPHWENLKKQFIDSFGNKEKLFLGSHRQQNRMNMNANMGMNMSMNMDMSMDKKERGGKRARGRFTNEPDTDFTLPANQEWAHSIRQKWMKKKRNPIQTIPLVFAGQDIKGNREIVDCVDKSQLNKSQLKDNNNILCGQYTRAKAEDLLQAVDVAVKDPDGWRNLTPNQRQQMLSSVADILRQRRGDLVGVAAAEVGKVFTETDVEVSEAVDFLEFYGHSLRYFEEIKNIHFQGKGVGLVVPPWNFPIAIPLGGLAATLAAGNTVILKPSSQAVLCSYEMCQCFWDAGVSKNTLQFLPCPGSLAEKHLVNHQSIDFVILTGGEETAHSMLKTRPSLFLTAETGGKNATIVTAMSDREQAIAHVVSSAFGNSGQKCSATSLLVLEEEVYDDPGFKEALVDATESLRVGSIWDFDSSLGPMAGPLDASLKKAIENLEEGESWALKPEFTQDNEYMLKPSIKWGVAPGSFCHRTELFAPLLSVLKARSLQHAIELVNQTGYGLTSGLESLDEREIKQWRENIQAGNLYINRSTTGAIVLRQPFGGWGKSAMGSGRKVGTYNYITQFMDIKDGEPPNLAHLKQSPYFECLEKWIHKHKKFRKDFIQLQVALESYLYHYKKEFNQEHDPCQVRGEYNIFRYIKLDVVALRVSRNDTLFECVSRIFAAKVSGVNIHVSLDSSISIDNTSNKDGGDNESHKGHEINEFHECNDVSEFLLTHALQLLQPEDRMTQESEVEFAKGFSSMDQIIYSKESEVSEFIFSEAAHSEKFIVRTPPLMEGRLELLHYFKEQSISHSYHRYGNLGER